MIEENKEIFPIYMHLQESVDMLIKCIVNTLGFSQNKPVAAFTIYKCLLHWSSFEAERTNVFDRLVSTFGLAIKVLFLLILTILKNHLQLNLLSFVERGR